MILLPSGKACAITGLKKRHRHYRELDHRKKWWVLKGSMQVAGVGDWGDESSVNGKDFCLNFLQPFLQNIDRRSYNDRSRELIPVLHDPYRKDRPSPSVVALTLVYPLRPRRVGGRKKQAWICCMCISTLTHNPDFIYRYAYDSIYSHFITTF